MKPLFSARSPLWQIAAVIILYPLLMLIAYARSQNVDSFTTADAYSLAYAAIALVLTGLYITMLVRYNRRHPNSKIDLTSSTPAELKEEDEGMRMITARATRLVYRFHTFALPLAAVLLIYLPLSIYSALSCLFVLSLGHYATYWYAIWPAFKESEEE